MDRLEGIVKDVFKCLGPDLEENLYALHKKIELLTSKKYDVEEELLYADGKKRKREVEDWLINVEDMIKEFETLKQDVIRSKFYKRQNLTERVEIMTKEVTELLDQSNFAKGFFLEFVTNHLLQQVSTKIREFLWTEIAETLAVVYPPKSRQTTLPDDFFLDPLFEIRVSTLSNIGDRVYQTFSNIGNRVCQTFSDRVYQVKVSRGSSIYKLQSDIAQALELDFSSENDEGKRANILFEAFKRRGRSVLILDDVRKQIDVEKIGIPVGMNGCKLIITSRSKEVCRQMNCQRIIEVDSVSEQEAWELFLKKFGSVKLQT